MEKTYLLIILFLNYSLILLKKQKLINKLKLYNNKITNKRNFKRCFLFLILQAFFFYNIFKLLNKINFIILISKINLIMLKKIKKIFYEFLIIIFNLFFYILFFILLLLINKI